MKDHINEFIGWAIFWIICFGILWFFLHPDKASAYTLDNWADAIKHAEGNANYGILKHYKHTSYRQACKNTVKHQYSLWLKSGLKTAFLPYLAHIYAPIGCSNDPHNLNINWQFNVAYWLRRV